MAPEDHSPGTSRSVFRLRRPSPQQIEAVLRSQDGLPFSYPEVGASARGAPPGYPTHHGRLRLGVGAETFARARAAMLDWGMYRLPWTEIAPRDTRVETGSVFVVVVRHFGFWSVNACRVVALEQERSTSSSFGFSIGTLPHHAERGEERFRAVWRHSDDSVWFELCAFAGPNHWLSRLGYPLMRSLQRRFAREAPRAMRAAVATDGGVRWNA